jgi:hypothetical protein
MSRHADNAGWDVLANRLGITVRAVHSLRKKPGAPTDPADLAWDLFHAENGRDLGSKTLRDQKIEEEIKILKLKHSQLSGEVASVAGVREFLAQVSARYSQLLRTKYDTELPAKLQGKDIVAIRRAIIDTTDSVADIVNAGLLEWTPKS